MSSCQLFHGPGARQAAVARAEEIGFLMVPPFGDDGLSVGQLKPSDPLGAREIVQLLLSVPVGSGIGVIIIGPIDNAKSLKAMDALLKSIEEVPSPYMQPILWAEDLGGVPSTIQSRCLDVWSPGTTENNPELAAIAKQIVNDVLVGRFYTIPGAVLDSKKVEDESPAENDDEDEGDEKKSAKKPKFRGVDLLWAITDEIASNLNDPDRLLLWERVRKVARWRNPTPVEIVAALVV